MLNGEPGGFPGDLLGCSVSVDVNTVAVGACGRSDRVVHTGRLASEEPKPASGAVYVFLRTNYNAYFYLAQRLVASNLKENDRFG